MAPYARIATATCPLMASAGTLSTPVAAPQHTTRPASSVTAHVFWSPATSVARAAAVSSGHTVRPSGSGAQSPELDAVCDAVAVALGEGVCDCDGVPVADAGTVALAELDVVALGDADPVLLSVTDAVALGVCVGVTRTQDDWMASGVYPGEQSRQPLGPEPAGDHRLLGHARQSPMVRTQLDDSGPPLTPPGHDRYVPGGHGVQPPPSGP